MGDSTGIEWTDKTYNPWHGCTKVSAGCDNCYMFSEKKQYGQDPTLVVRSKTKFRDPLKWKEPARVFTCSWSDFFHKAADEWRPEVWDTIRATPHLQYQILTKRPGRILRHLPADWGEGYANVWLGVSVEDQENAFRIDQLREIPARTRFISCEPLIGPLAINFLEGIDWLIAGGESGPGARPCDLEWIRGLISQCRVAGVSCFVKQLGARPYSIDDGISHRGNKIKMPDGFYRFLNDRKGGDISEWPERLRVREFPR